MLVVVGIVCCVVIASAIALEIHRVHERHIAVYFRGGALLMHTDKPGFRLAFPLIITCEHMQTTLQSDNVLYIPCETAGGTVMENEHWRLTDYALARHYHIESLLRL